MVKLTRQCMQMLYDKMPTPACVGFSITPGIVVSRKPSLCVKPWRQSALKGANSVLQMTSLQMLFAGSNLAFFRFSVKAAESGSLGTVL